MEHFSSMIKIGCNIPKSKYISCSVNMLQLGKIIQYSNTITMFYRFLIFSLFPYIDLDFFEVKMNTSLVIFISFNYFDIFIYFW